jgi:hypothetical protein
VRILRWRRDRRVRRSSRIDGEGRCPSGAAGSAGASGNAGAGGGNAGASGNAGAGGGSAGASGSAGAGGGSAGAGGGSAGASGSAGNGGAGGGLACGDGTGQGDQCNTIVGSATGPCVVTTMSADTAPTPAGGSVSSGNYQLTSSTFYGTLPDGAASSDGDFGTHRETFLIYVQSATSFNLDQFRADGTQNSSDQGMVSISGTTLTYTQTCPAPGDGGSSGGSASYTATSSAFTLMIAKNGGVLVKVYTKVS